MVETTQMTVSFSSEIMKGRGSGAIFAGVERKELSIQSSTSSRNILQEQRVPQASLR